MDEVQRYTLDEAHKEFAKRFNGKVWGLLDMSDRTPLEDEEMLLAAYASLYHWTYAGSAAHRQRGIWLLAHVYSVLGDAGQALKHASRCLDLTEENREQMEDFDIAYAYEALARANRLAGNLLLAGQYLELAKVAGEQIADPESKQIFLGDLAS